MKTRLLLLAVLTSLSLGCKRDGTRAVVGPIGVPPDAVFLLSAPSLRELRAVAARVEPLPAAAADDEAQPAWLACEPSVCVLRRGTPVEAVSRSAGQVTAPDADGSLVIWGLAEDDDLDARLARWRTGAPAPAGWSGFVTPDAALARWKPSNPHAKELLAGATAQAGRIEFTARATAQGTDVELRMTPRAGEEALVGSLGHPTADPPDVTGLLVDEMLGLVRLSADPHELWALVRTVATAEQRAALDELVATLRGEGALDIERQILDTLTGHIFIALYERSALAEPALNDWLLLRATHEAVVLPIRERTPIRRALGAWTQLSRGRLQALTTAAQSEEQHDEWGYFDDGELRFSVVLGANFVAFVDSTVALDRARSWSTTVPVPAELTRRGIGALLEGRDRYGLYADAALLEAWFGALPYGSVAATVAPDGRGELVRAHLTDRRPSPAAPPHDAGR